MKLPVRQSINQVNHAIKTRLKEFPATWHIQKYKNESITSEG